MNPRISSLVVGLLLASGTISLGQNAATTKAPATRNVTALWNDLAKPINSEPFLQTMTLKSALTQVQEQFQQRYGRALSIDINHRAFKDENPEAPDLNDLEMKIRSLPKTSTVRQVLRSLIAQVPTNNATLFLKPGVIEITTHSSVIPARLLGQTVDLKFTRQPLSFVLEQIYEQTGVSVILDPRVGINARAPVSITFTNDLTLGTGLLLIAEMAQLKLLVTDNAIFITTPAHARQFLWERMVNPYGLPSLLLRVTIEAA
jgi:hypothetical protein